MKVTIVEITDREHRLVRTRSQLGDLAMTWRGAPLPVPGARLDVELDLGPGSSRWEEDVVRVADGSISGVEQGDGLFYLTGLADYAGDRILYVKPAADCLISLVLDVDIGEEGAFGMVRVRSRVLEAWPTNT